MHGQILPDNGLINRSSIDAMRAWSAILGFYQVEILVAVAAVGAWHEDVRAYLQAKFCFSSREPDILVDHFVPEPEMLAA